MGILEKDGASKKIKLEVCPACQSRGRAVKGITVASLVCQEAWRGLPTIEGFYFCSSIDCAVVYFHLQMDMLIGGQQMRVGVGQKERGLGRRVCYCFGYTAADVTEQVFQTGACDILDEIKEKCRQGLSRCERENPQGFCCLGCVGGVVKDAMSRQGLEGKGGDDE